MPNYLKCERHFWSENICTSIKKEKKNRKLHKNQINIFI